MNRQEGSFALEGVGGPQIKDVVLIPGTCENVTLHGHRELRLQMQLRLLTR